MIHEIELEDHPTHLGQVFFDLHNHVIVAGRVAIGEKNVARLKIGIG